MTGAALLSLSASVLVGPPRGAKRGRESACRRDAHLQRHDGSLGILGALGPLQWLAIVLLGGLAICSVYFTSGHHVSPPQSSRDCITNIAWSHSRLDPGRWFLLPALIVADDSPATEA